MTTVLGFRATVAVLVPSTNTTVEADFNALRVPGVTFHAARMRVSQPRLDSDAAFERLLDEIGRVFEGALADVLTCEPDHLVMGMSAPTFWGGRAGNDAFVTRARSLAGVPVTTGSDACRVALEAHRARRIAVLTPYPAIMRAQIVRFFGDCGFEVVRHEDLGCESATAIAQVPEARLRAALARLDGDDVDAIVQAGTNLPMVRLAAEAERWLGKPVVAINAATVWRAYRALGIEDRLFGFGALLEGAEARSGTDPAHATGAAVTS